MAARRATFDSASLPLGLEPRTVFVTGKGGVGKSTVAAALALAWRDAGARTLLVEIEGQASASSMLSDRVIGYDPVPIGEHLAACRLGLNDALREYARIRLKMRMVADRLVSNPIIDQFAQAAPGFRELLVLGKLWALARAKDERGEKVWDAIVVDSPATGHSLGLLGMAGTVARMFPVGPIAAEARAIDAFVRDEQRVGAVLVALPEELPVTETLELCDELAARGIAVAAPVLNGLLVDRFSSSEAKTLAARSSNDLPLSVRHALDTAHTEHERCSDQAAERARLETGIGGDVCVLPHMFVPELQQAHITSLARWLAPAGQRILLDQLAGAADGPAAAAAVHAAQVGRT